MARGSRLEARGGLEVGYWVLGVGCWVLGVGCWVLGVGCWVLVVGCWLLIAWWFVGCSVSGGGCLVLFVWGFGSWFCFFGVQEFGFLAFRKCISFRIISRSINILRVSPGVSRFTRFI